MTDNVKTSLTGSIIGVVALAMVLMAGVITSSKSAHEHQTVQEVEMLQRGDIVEAQNGHYYMVWAHVHRSEFPIFRMLYKDRGIGMNNYHFRSEEIKRIIHHDDHEAAEIWARMRPAPEKKIVERE